MEVRIYVTADDEVGGPNGPRDAAGGLSVLSALAAQECLELQALHLISHLRRHLLIAGRLDKRFYLGHPRWRSPSQSKPPEIEWTPMRWPLTEPGSKAACIGLLGDEAMQLMEYLGEPQPSDEQDDAPPTAHYAGGEPDAALGADDASRSLLGGQHGQGQDGAEHPVATWPGMPAAADSSVDEPLLVLIETWERGAPDSPDTHRGPDLETARRFLRLAADAANLWAHYERGLGPAAAREKLVLVGRARGVYCLALPTWRPGAPGVASGVTWSEVRWPLTPPGSEAAFRGLFGQKAERVLEVSSGACPPERAD